MTGSHSTPYRKDALFVENGTRPPDLFSYVKRRATNPRRIGEMTVWNFNNHELDREQLRRQEHRLQNDAYLVPYQVSGAWAFMSSLLPDHVRSAETLVYDQDSGTYNPYPNYFRHATEDERTRVRQDIRDTMPSEVKVDD